MMVWYGPKGGGLGHHSPYDGACHMHMHMWVFYVRLSAGTGCWCASETIRYLGGGCLDWLDSNVMGV